MIKPKDFASIKTVVYLSVIFIGMVSAYFFLANFQSRVAEKNSAAQTQNDAQDQEVKGGNIFFMAPRAQNVIYDQGAE